MHKNLKEYDRSTTYPSTGKMSRGKLVQIETDIKS